MLIAAMNRGFDLIAASMAAGFQKTGVLKELPKDLKKVNPENVKFVLDHEAELNAMRADMEKMG